MKTDNNTQIYRRRFAQDLEFRRDLWRALVSDFFQKYIPDNATVLEIAAGYCEFINAVEADRKIAVDLNPDTREYADPSVEVEIGPATELSMIESESIDAIWMSNFLEHITREEIDQVISECRRCLRPGGRLLILQPNVRYVKNDYWMFIDHITPIDDRALTELLEVKGFGIHTCLPRFLPYTMQGRLPKSVGLARLYLRLSPLWRIFGGQAFVVAEVV